MLASIILASLNTARSKARDAKRIADLDQLRSALELYYSDHGSYPIVDQAQGWWWGTCSSFGSHSTSGANGYIPGLAPQYISALPTDTNPVGTYGCYIYTGRNNGQDYMILAYQTVETHPTLIGNPEPRPVADGLSSTCGDSNGYEPDFALYTPGGQCY